MRLYRARFGDQTLQVVAAVVVVGLVARLVLLGTRITHFDEARVAFWTLRYAETGEIHYRYGIHGTFVRYAGRLTYALFGPTDFAARLPVALVGGLLPAVSLWLRHRLEDTEVVALAFLLAANPLLLYYSRFLRSSLLVAAFCFAAFAAFLRVYDGFGAGYLYVGAVLLGFGVASKENAVVYVVCWLGAAALLVDTALFRPKGFASGRERAVAVARYLRERYVDDPTARRRAGVSVGHLVGATAVLALVVLFFYAPRGGEAGLWSGNFGPTVDRTIDDLRTGFEFWFGHGEEKTISEYRDTLQRFIGTTLGYAGPLFLFSVAGFLLDRYGRADQRALVAFCAYWGFASVVGYPLGTDIWGAWIVVNALVPLAVPAAVGLAALFEVGREAHAADDWVSAGVVGVLLLLVAGQVAGVGVAGVYAAPTSTDNEMVQFAQPQQEMRPAVEATVEAASATDDGPNALFYGNEAFVDMDETDLHTPACIDWFNTLPWGWYLEADDVSVTCARNPGGLPDSPPPVVIAEAECTLERPVDCRERTDALRAVDDIDDRLGDSYERYGFLHRTTGGNDFHGVVVFVDHPDRTG